MGLVAGTHRCLFACLFAGLICVSASTICSLSLSLYVQVCGAPGFIDLSEQGGEKQSREPGALWRGPLVCVQATCLFWASIGTGVAECRGNMFLGLFVDQMLLLSSLPFSSYTPPITVLCEPQPANLHSSLHLNVG